MADTTSRRTDDEATGFTAAEREAMKERSRELRAGRGKRGNADGTHDLLAKIAEMPSRDRAMAERLHVIITEHAPTLAPKTWYGMPAYAKDGKVLCFFQSADKFKARYATFGFNDVADLDDGAMWPTSFALHELTPEAEVTIASLVQRAAS